MGTFVTPVRLSAEVSVDTSIIALPVEPILKEGIAVADIAKFLETQVGSKYCADHAVLCKVEVGEVLWVPYGMLPLVMASTELAKEGDVDKKVVSTALATFVVFSPLVKAWCAAVPEAALKVLMSWNLDHAKKLASGGQALLWKDRHELLQKFQAEILGTT
jgi:hypothetical protein